MCCSFKRIPTGLNNLKPWAGILGEDTLFTLTFSFYPSSFVFHFILTCSPTNHVFLGSISFSKVLSLSKIHFPWDILLILQSPSSGSPLLWSLPWYFSLSPICTQRTLFKPLLSDDMLLEWLNRISVFLHLIVNFLMVETLPSLSLSCPIPPSIIHVYWTGFEPGDTLIWILIIFCFKMLSQEKKMIYITGVKNICL